MTPLTERQELMNLLAVASVVESLKAFLSDADKLGQHALSSKDAVQVLKSLLPVLAASIIDKRDKLNISKEEMMDLYDYAFKQHVKTAFNVNVEEEKRGH